MQEPNLSFILWIISLITDPEGLVTTPITFGRKGIFFLKSFEKSPSSESAFFLLHEN